MLIWQPVKNKDGTINKYAYEDSTKRYRIGIYRVNGEFVYQAWRGSSFLYCGTSQAAKQAAYDDSLIPHPKVTGEIVASAIEEIKARLK